MYIYIYIYICVCVRERECINGVFLWIPSRHPFFKKKRRIPRSRFHPAFPRTCYLVPSPRRPRGWKPPLCHPIDPGPERLQSTYPILGKTTDAQQM